MLIYPSPKAEYLLKRKVKALESQYLSIGKMIVRVSVELVETPVLDPLEEKIINYVCSFYKVKWEQAASNSRGQIGVKAKYMACYLMRQYLKYPFHVIGCKIGRKDHTTAVHGYNKVADFYSIKDEEVTHCIEGFEKLYNNEISQNYDSAKKA